MTYLRANISLLHSCCANLSLFFKNRAKYSTVWTKYKAFECSNRWYT